MSTQDKLSTQDNPNMSYDPNRLTDPTRTYIDDRRSPSDLNNALQPDPQLAEGPASNTRVTMMALGIAVVLGLVFYGMNQSTVQQQASSAPMPANGQSSSTALPTPPPGMRDVTPRSNTQPGMTTGAAPMQPANPQVQSPASTQPGGANTNVANPGNAK
jgi:hypothetical protein